MSNRKSPRTTRRKMRRAAKRAAASSGVPDAVNKNKNVDDCKTDSPQKTDAPKLRWEEYAEKILKVGAVASFLVGFLCVAANGFFNFFSDNPVIQLYPFSCAFSLLVLFVFQRWSRVHKNLWAYLPASLVVIAVMAATITLAKKKTLEKEGSAAERKQERGIITETPARFDKMDAGLASVQLSFSNWWQESKLERKRAGEALDEVKAAIRPRMITPQQREKFINILAESHNVSKFPIKVIVGTTDSETENFALQFRKMLDEAGYGTKPSPFQIPPDEAFKAEGTNVLYVTNSSPRIKLPPFTIDGASEELVRIPGLFIEKSTLDVNQQTYEVIAVFHGGQPRRSALSSVMPMYPTTNYPGYHKAEVIHAYHPTQDPDDVLVGVSRVLIELGIRPSAIKGPGLLKAGEVAFFIPQKFY